MTDKRKKLDYLDRLLVLLDKDSIEMLYEEVWEILELEDTDALNPESTKGEFYSTMMARVSELGEIRNELQLFKELLEE